MALNNRFRILKSTEECRLNQRKSNCSSRQEKMHIFFNQTTYDLIIFKFTQCKNLVNKDLFSKSDPMLFVDIMDGRTGVFERLGVTEMIKDNLNPEFKREIELNYVFEKKQHLRITILDVDDPDNYPREYTPNVCEQDRIGTTAYYRLMFWKAQLTD